MYRNFLCATSVFSHFSSASVWALPKGHRCFRLPAVLVWGLSTGCWGSTCSAIGISFLCPLTLVLPLPFLTLPFVPSSCYCLLAFPFVRHVFSFTLAAGLRHASGLVNGAGWNVWCPALRNLRPLSMEAAPAVPPCQYHDAIGTEWSDLCYLDHFQFLLLFLLLQAKVHHPELLRNYIFTIMIYLVVYMCCCSALKSLHLWFGLLLVMLLLRLR